jgi:hypothetical protein
MSESEKLSASTWTRSGYPEPFYLGLGFRHTGRVDGAEIVLEHRLDTIGLPARPTSRP